MKTKTSATILALLFAGSAEAIRYRPYVDGRTPWYKTFPSAPEIDFPHDYPVANFGVDHDIKSTFTHTAAAEARLGHVMQASFTPPPPPPRDYFVPNFGEDSDIKSTKAHAAAAEAALGHQMHASFAAPAEPPRDYFVPNFGADFDVKETLKHASAAEAKFGPYVGAKAPDHPTDYFVPNFGEDSDVKSTKGHIAAAEAALGHNLKASFAQPDGPNMNYFVPNFGVDHDIKDSQYNTALTEQKMGHVWQNAKAAAPEPPRNYFVPDFGVDKDIKDSQAHLAATEKAMNHQMTANTYVQNQVDLHTESDPICSSAGCTQYKHKKKDRGYDINYFVPNFGRDTDMINTDHSLAISEDALSHKLELGTEKSKAKWKNPAKDTDYNFAPKLDGDMISTAKNLEDAQTNLNHKWVIE